jgi:sulfite reductase alpha subunit-like flavoprotein
MQNKTTAPPPPLQILIGPGTGVALPLALLDDRRQRAQRGEAVCVNNLLFFGCRHRRHDHYAWPALQDVAEIADDDERDASDDSDTELVKKTPSESGSGGSRLLRYHAAFSRDESQKGTFSDSLMLMKCTFQVLNTFNMRYASKLCVCAHCWTVVRQ